MGGALAQWLRCFVTDGQCGSTGVRCCTTDGRCGSTLVSCCLTDGQCGSTGVRCCATDGQCGNTVVIFFTKSGKLNFPEPSVLVPASNGTASPLPLPILNCVTEEYNNPS